jgi:hypothetical protein
MHSPVATPPTREEQQELIRRILGSELFSKSHRLSAFLRFVYEQHSQGFAVNEQRIGTEVFGRPLGFHAGEDSIVRSQARFLRQRLEEYFAHEGSQEPISVCIPKGSYVPAFERRILVPPLSKSPDEGAQTTVAAAVTASGSPDAHPLTPERAKWPEWSRRALLILPVCLAAMALAWFSHTHAWQAAQGESPAVRTFWASLFNPARTTLIVPADSTLVLIEEITGKPVHLNSYVSRDYMNVKPPERVPLWDMLVGSQYTSTADLNLVAHLERVPEAVLTRPEIRSARDISLKDLKERNAILIGGLRANPWMELFAQSTGFDVDYDLDSHHNLVRNRNPGPGEEPLYVEDSHEASGARAYGVIVYLPSLDTQGNSLLVEGTSKAGTEAAAEFLTSPAFDPFLRAIGASRGAVPSFAVLLSTGMMDGASYHPAVVCWHLLHKSPNS